MEGQPPTNSIGPNQGAEVSLPPAVQPGVKLIKKLIKRKKVYIKENIMKAQVIEVANKLNLTSRVSTLKKELQAHLNKLKASLQSIKMKSSNPPDQQ